MCKERMEKLRQNGTGGVQDLLKERMVLVENGFEKANNHETGVGDLLEEWNILGIETKLVSSREVGVSSGKYAVVVNNDERLIGHLGLSVFQDSVSVNIPWITDIVIVQDALLVLHNHLVIKVVQVDNANLFCWK
jgi:hypothetical protein